MNDRASLRGGRSTALRAEYVARINRVIDHIETHLDEPLRLESLAEIAHFSPFHFHRIFHAMLGETLSRFVQRLRCERAAMQLRASPSKSISEIALDCGFSSSQVFARAFREQFGMSASELREGRTIEGEGAEDKGTESGATGHGTGGTNRKIRNTDRKQGEERDYAADDITVVHHSTRSAHMTRSIVPTVTVQDFPETTVAYVRHIGPYQANPDLFGRLFGRLFQWAGPRRLIGPDTLVLCIYHDDPNITAPEKLRTDVCLSVPAGTAVSGEIGTLTIPAGRYAFARVELTAEQFGEAWDAVCGDWLPESGYEPADGLSFEIYRNDHREHPEKKFIVDICVPVRPMA